MTTNIVKTQVITLLTQAIGRLTCPGCKVVRGISLYSLLSLRLCILYAKLCKTNIYIWFFTTKTGERRKRTEKWKKYLDTNEIFPPTLPCTHLKVYLRLQPWWWYTQKISEVLHVWKSDLENVKNIVNICYQYDLKKLISSNCHQKMLTYKNDLVAKATIKTIVAQIRNSRPEVFYKNAAVMCPGKHLIFWFWLCENFKNTYL